MMNFAKALAVLLVISAGMGWQAHASKNKTLNNRRLLVRYKDGVSIHKRDKAHFSVGAYVVKSFTLPNNLEVVEVAKGISLKSAQEYYKNDPNVLYAEPDYSLFAFLSPAPGDGEEPPMGDDPDNPPVEKIDPRYDEQWGLHNSGQEDGILDVDINAPEMWEHIQGDENIVIAVIDTGIDYEHPDLRNNMWTNPGEIPGNGIDDDDNGVIDDVHGFNAVDKNGDPMDDHSHGTHCAGIIGAESQNYHGGRGVMQKVSLIGCKFLSSGGRGDTSDAIACLDYLLDLKTREKNPVNIFATSNSWGGPMQSEALQDAIEAHQEAGILFVAAASNEGKDNDVVETYPADYPVANIVSVAAINRKDELAWFSNYGRRTVHVGAPGEDILSTVLNKSYKMESGTSMAAPFVSGLAGIIKAVNPSFDFIQVKNLLMAGGVPTEALQDKTISGRRIRALDQNGLGSLSCVDQIIMGRLSPSVDRLLVPVGESITLSAININCSEPNGAITVPVLPLNNDIQLMDHGDGLDSIALDGMYTREWVASETGKYEFVFPGDDIVKINVYDISYMKPYALSVEDNFNYREFEGTALEAGDDWVGAVEIPFPVHFGSETEYGFEILNINSNGALSLTDRKMANLSNAELPSSDFVSLLAPMWDDLDPSAGDGGIYYGVLGEEPHREFVVEWRDVRHYSSMGGVTFQVVLFEDSSDILFNYRDVDFDDEARDKGASATIGVQSTGEYSNQFGFNEAVLESNMALRFTLGEIPEEPVPELDPIEEEMPESGLEPEPEEDN